MRKLRTEQEIMQLWNPAEKPLVSVCCLTYNHEQYIDDAIEGFLIQETDFPFEILIHDDASTDNTANVVRMYVEKYPTIIKPIFQTENQYSKGGLISPKFLFPVALGRYIALCEGDDYWTDKTKLQKQVAYLENSPECVITYTDCRPFDKTGNLNIDFLGARHDLTESELKRAVNIFTLTTCFRNVIKEVPFELTFARFGDLVIWSLLGHYGRGKYLSNISPAAYRVHDGGVHSRKTSKEKAEMGLKTDFALYSYYSKIHEEELSQYFKKKILKRILRSIGCGGVTRTLFEVLIRKIIFVFAK